MAIDNHAFSVKDAELYGVDAAILLYNLKYWLDGNRANKRNLHDGYYWSYNSAKAYAEIFPYWTANKIQKTLKKLESDGVIITGNYSESKYDRTKWYSMPEFKVKNPSADSPNEDTRLADSSLSNINTNIINTDSFSSNKEDIFLERLIREEFPHCYKAIEQLKQYRDTYTGKLSLDEWLFCEGQMASVDFDYKYIHWWMEDKAKSFTKKPSLPNLLSDMNGIEFSDYYSKVEDNF